MAKVGYFLSCEQHPAAELVRQGALAERAGFDGLWISDHYHPWNSEQGQSPFVWSVIGALSQVTQRVTVTTAVTCPTVRVHPAVIAQAAATSATLLPGRFHLGIGSGEALNEHVLGDRWPETDVRLEMLEEAVQVIRALWTGEQVSHRGTHYTVEDARIWSLPDELPAILVSGFGTKATELAGRIGDGFVCVFPSGELVQAFRNAGGAGKPTQAGMKVCWGPDEAACRRTAHRLWPNDLLPGELAQLLPTPTHFEQAASLVTEDMVAESITCGPDPERHAAAMRAYVEAGFDEVYVQQVGDNVDGFVDFWQQEVVPRV